VPTPKPAAPAREALEIAGGVVALFVVDRGVGVVFSWVGFEFPSAVAGMLLCFALLALGRVLGLPFVERVTLLLEPARRFLGRWMALFFVPPLALLPLAPAPGPGELWRVLVVLSAGFVTTLVGTALVARALSGHVETAAPALAQARFWSVPALLGVSLVVTLAGLAAAFFGVDLGRVAFGVGLTICSFVLGDWLRGELARRGAILLSSLCHPVGVGALGTSLVWSGLRFPLREYLALGGDARGPGNLLVWCLAPAVVALGLSLDRERELLRRAAVPLLTATAFAAAFSLFANAGLSRLFGLSVAYARALVPRSVTTPIALSIARLIDGDPSLTAVLVIVSGVLGALVARPLLERLGFHSPIALGVATGAASHGIGTAALLREAPRAAALSGIAFALTASISVALVSLPPVRTLLLLLTG
jgi:putative effector of murein hydrolase/putative effector of murein hydrolase LrgA (UPF0299 family)